MSQSQTYKQLWSFNQCWTYILWLCLNLFKTVFVLQLRLMLTCLSLFKMLRCIFLPDTHGSFCTEDALNISDMNETHDWGPLFRRQLLEFIWYTTHWILKDRYVGHECQHTNRKSKCALFPNFHDLSIWYSTKQLFHLLRSRTLWNTAHSTQLLWITILAIWIII